MAGGNEELSIKRLFLIRCRSTLTPTPFEHAEVAAAGPPQVGRHAIAPGVWGEERQAVPFYRLIAIWG
jgi:hypothetical protein